MNATLGMLVFLTTCVLSFEGHFASGKIFHNLTVGDSLLASTNDVLLSPNGRFAVGFFPDVQNQFYFGCWFTGEFS